MSQKMGLSAEAYQEWDAIMQHSGTSIESLQAGMKTLANAVENGNDAFKRLGISQEQIASMNNEELFSATITALQNVENETERTYLAGQLLGRGATELGALLNTSAEDTEAMRQRVHELGGVMSDEAVKAAASFQDSLQDLQTGISGIKRGLLSDFLPSITQVMDGLTSLVSGEEGGIEAISSGIDNFIDNLINSSSRMFEIGGGILEGLSNAIIQNLPKLIDAGADILLSLADGILEQLPLLVESGLQIILTLADKISESLPELIPTIVDVVLQIVDTLTDPDSLSSLIEAALKIIVALARGLTEAIPELISAIPDIIASIVTVIITELPDVVASGIKVLFALIDGIIGAIPELVAAIPNLIIGIVNGILNNLGDIIAAGPEIIMALIEGVIGAIPALLEMIPDLILSVVETITSYDWSGIGENIVDGLLDGLSNAWEDLTDWVGDKFGSLVDSVKSLLGIHSPSRVFAGIGENMAAGLGDGWDDEFSRVKRQIEGGMDFGTASIGVEARGGYGPQGPAYSGAGGAVNANQPQDIIINLTAELDGTVLSRKMIRYNAKAETLVGESMVSVSR